MPVSGFTHEDNPILTMSVMDYRRMSLWICKEWVEFTESDCTSILLMLNKSDQIPLRKPGVLIDAVTRAYDMAHAVADDKSSRPIPLDPTSKIKQCGDAGTFLQRLLDRAPPECKTAILFAVSYDAEKDSYSIVQSPQGRKKKEAKKPDGSFGR